MIIVARCDVGCIYIDFSSTLKLSLMSPGVSSWAEDIK